MANTTNTGLTISDTSNLEDGQVITIAAAKEAFEPSAPDPSIISNERIPNGSKQWDILTYARLADARALTEGVDLSTVEQLFTNYLSINPSEHGSIVSLSKRAKRRQPESLERVAGSMQGISLRARMAKDVITLYDGGSKSIGGGNGATLDITHFRGSVSYLMTDNDTEFGPAPMPLISALHAEGISDIIADLTQGSASSVTRTAATSPAVGVSEDIIHRWWKGSDRAYGVQVFHSGYMTRDAGDDYKGFLGSGDALHIVMETDAEPTIEEDNSLRVDEHGLFQSWGEGERADPHFVEMYFDGAATV